MIPCDVTIDGNVISVDCSVSDYLWAPDCVVTADISLTGTKTATSWQLAGTIIGRNPTGACADFDSCLTVEIMIEKIPVPVHDPCGWTCPDCPLSVLEMWIETPTDTFYIQTDEFDWSMGIYSDGSVDYHLETEYFGPDGITYDFGFSTPQIDQAWFSPTLVPWEASRVFTSYAERRIVPGFAFVPTDVSGIFDFYVASEDSLYGDFFLDFTGDAYTGGVPTPETRTVSGFFGFLDQSPGSRYDPTEVRPNVNSPSHTRLIHALRSSLLRGMSMPQREQAASSSGKLTP